MLSKLSQSINQVAGKSASGSKNNALPSTSRAIGISCGSNVGITAAVCRESVAYGSVGASGEVPGATRRPGSRRPPDPWWRAAPAEPPALVLVAVINLCSNGRSERLGVEGLLGNECPTAAHGRGERAPHRLVNRFAEAQGLGHTS